MATTGLALCFVGASIAAAYSVADHAASVLDTMPVLAQKLRNAVRTSRLQGGTPIEKLKEAATELRNVANEAASPEPSKDVVRVQVEPPSAGHFDYAWWATAMTSFVGRTVTIVFLVFLFLISGDQYKRKVVKLAGPALSRKKITVHILDDINKQIERYLLVTLFVGVLSGLTTALLAWGIGLEHPIFWGIAATVFSTVPFFGPALIALGLGVTAFVRFDSFTLALSVSAASLVLSVLKGSLLAPWLSSKTARMNNIAIVTGLMFWAWLWGIPGVLLAVPIMTTFKAICDRVEGLQPIGAFLAD
jgi:predicted PurR-regulated permease PerM